MGFWIRNLIFGVILAAAAYILLANQELLVDIIELFESDEKEVAETIVISESTSSENVTELAATPAPVAPKVEKKSGNAAAEGLSRFYASINPSFNEKGPRIRENIVYLPDPKGNLSEILEARKKVTRPLRKNWRGNREARPFRVGETLYQKLSEYGQEQGVEVMWWLNRDFLVKDPFRIDKDIVKTAFQVGKAIEGHFEHGVDIYFCYKHRTLVLIAEPNSYLTTECTHLSNQQSTW